jgi:hypothetical protein
VQGPFRLNVLAALLLFVGIAVFAAEVELTAEVPAEKWRALRLKGLPQGASLAVRVETSGPIRVILAREDEAQRFPKGLKAAFSGSTERSLSFRIRVPVAGTYYVILDNRKGDAQRDVKVYVQALPARKPPPRPAPKQPGETAT